MKDTILSVNNLKTYFYNNNRCNRVLNGISFDLKKGKILGVVGESGCGKSVTAASIMRLLPDLARIEEGSIIYRRHENNINIEKLEKNGKMMRCIRGGEISMIFQDPMTALNPVYTVGFQIAEVLREHKGLKKKEAFEESVRLLDKMGIPFPEHRAKEYPHQFSGGMRQRAVIAMAMACSPAILIADEPTTALDVTIQAQIFELIDGLRVENDMAVMLITHDMGVVSALADEVVVMYMGNIIERGSTADILKSPRHPYTKALLHSIPVLGRGKKQNIAPIKGATPDPYNRPRGCQFSPRCELCREKCYEMPPEIFVRGGRSVRCWEYEGAGDEK